MATCFMCNHTAETEQGKAEGSLPPNFHKRKISGQTYVFCSKCIGDMMPGTDYHLDDYEVPFNIKKKIRSSRG